MRVNNLLRAEHCVRLERAPACPRVREHLRAPPAVPVRTEQLRAFVDPRVHNRRSVVSAMDKEAGAGAVGDEGEPHTLCGPGRGGWVGGGKGRDGANP